MRRLPFVSAASVKHRSLGFNLAQLPLAFSPPDGPEPWAILSISLPSCLLLQPHHSIQPKTTKDTFPYSARVGRGCRVGGQLGVSPRFNSTQTDVIHQALCEEATGAQEGRKRKTENNEATRKVFRSWALQWKQTGIREQCSHHDMIGFHIFPDPALQMQAAHLP